jgi:replicative DNA helicase
MNQDMMRVVTGAASKLAQSKLALVRPANRNLSTICSAVRRAHREIGIKVAAIDFAQLIKAPGKSGVEEVEHISHTIHELAQELEIAIVLPSQLNQDGDTKNGRVIEEDAAAVVSIIQDRNKESETYRMHRHVLIVADRFYGSDGERVPMILDRERIRFVEGRDETAKAQKPNFKR